MVQYPLHTELKRVLPSGIQSVEVENDRYPLLVAERLLGYGKEVDHFAVVNLGTGLSVAFFDRTTVRGESSLAGEMGLATRYIPGLRRECSIESVVSGAGIAALFQSEFGEARSAAEIFSLTDSDERAAKLSETFVSTLANLLVDISYFANPAVIVLHGSLTLSAPRFLSSLQELYARRVDSLSKARIEISRVQHANCFGAAFLCDAPSL
jgi:predicted NBD/HSP70 family sugar kinase